jgi:hypothetical protein
MSKKYKHISSFNNYSSRDNTLLEFKKPVLSNLIHASHNTEAEIKKTLEELRFFIFKNSIIGSSQVVIYYEAFIFLRLKTYPLSRLEISSEGMETSTRSLLRIGQLL